MKAREDKRRKEALLPPPPIIACKRQVSAAAEITELVKRQKKQARNARRPHEHEHGTLSINYVCSEGWPKKQVKGQSADTLDIINFDIWIGK